MKKKTKEYLSKCCNAYIIGVISPDFIGDVPDQMQIGTCYYKCSKCNKPCDIKIKKERKRNEKQ